MCGSSLKNKIIIAIFEWISYMHAETLVLVQISEIQYPKIAFLLLFYCVLGLYNFNKYHQGANKPY